jgi:hypothetical protein
MVDPNLGYGTMSDTYGGQQIVITASPELKEMFNWWKEWNAILANPHPSVRASVEELKTLHAITK